MGDRQAGGNGFRDSVPSFVRPGRPLLVRSVRTNHVARFDSFKEADF